MNSAFEMSLAQRLAERGEEMDLRISSDHDRLLRAFDEGLYFPAAITYAFTWTGHAVMKEDFPKCAIDYLATGTLESLRRARRFSGRFGPERLSDGLKGWKTILDHSGVQDLLSNDAQGLWLIQKQSLNVASELTRHRQITGIGPWLFCAPFKIVATHRRDLWQTTDLDNLLMPLGLEVVRGVRKLIEQRCSFCRGLDMSMLSEEEGGLDEGMGTIWLVQDMSKKIADLGKTRVLHVNSGLYLYGKGKL